MRRISAVIGCFILLLLALNFPVGEAAAKKGISYSDPEFRATVDMLSMDGHSNDDLSSCAVKQEYYQDVAEMFNTGMTKKEILDYYQNELGVQALLVPPANGFNLTLWITPFLLLLIVFILLYFIIKKWKKNQNSFVIEEEFLLENIENDIYFAMIEEERKKKEFY